MRGASSARSSGSAASLGMFTFIFIILEIIAFVWCSIQQINTTHDSVFGLLQGGIIIPSHMTAAQLQLFLMGDMDKFNKIAYTIAFITQVVFLSALMPGSPIHNERLRFIVVVIFFILEVTSDLWYSAATNASLGSAFVWVFNFGIDAFTRLGRVFSAMTTAR